MPSILSGSSAATDRSVLHMITYLSPGIPVKLYQTYQYYFEEVLGCPSYLSVESRWSGPPRGTVDPFTANDVDLAFVCSTNYIRLLEEKNKFVEILPVAPIHSHPKSNGLPVYFAEVITRKEKEELHKEFIDLRGHKWAYTGEESLSGRLSILAQLKQLGFDTNFFGHGILSGSHHDSIQLVLNNIADTAAIDSNVLQYWLKDHPEHEEELNIVTTLGPFPVQPIIVNSRLPGHIKEKITKALLSLSSHPTFSEKFRQLGVTGFGPVDMTHYDRVKEIFDITKDSKMHPAYY